MLKKYIVGILSIALSVSVLSCKKASMANNETEHQAINRIEMLFKQSGNIVEVLCYFEIAICWLGERE